MEFYCSTEDLFILICFVIFMSILYARKYYVLHYNKSDWKLIGHIKHIYIYPIQGGYRKEMNQVNCSNSGLTGYSAYNKTLWDDRTFLICSNLPAVVQENVSIEGEKNEELKWAILHHPEFVTLKTSILKNIQKGNLHKCTYPDGAFTTIRDCGFTIAAYLNATYGCGKANKFYLGNHNKCAKIAFSKKYRFRKNEDIISGYNSSLNPEFSMISLVNDESVKDVKRISGSHDLTPSNFRPNFVIEAPQYCEDKVEFLKIGTATFSNLLPCAIDEYVNVDPELGTLSDNGQPYSTLLNNRKIKDVRPDLTTTSNMPVFGITLQVTSNGKISVGDPVYAKFMECP